jgi:hypothetical protein
MTAISGTDRNTKRVNQRWRNFAAVAAGVLIYEGAMVAVDSSGNVRPARANSGDRVLGIAARRVDNTLGGAGATPAGGVDIDSDSLGLFENSASTDAITDAHVGYSCYAVDDQTVALTDNGGARPRAGKIHKVEGGKVWVDFNTRPSFVAVPAYMADLGTASSTYAVSPVAGMLRKVYSAAHGAVLTTDAVCTSAIQPKAGGGFAAVTGGGLTVAVAGAAAGDSDEATPTAANLVAAGDTLRFTTDGGPSNVVPATITFLIEVAAA